jgi:hypothetical protein
MVWKPFFASSRGSLRTPHDFHINPLALRCDGADGAPSDGTTLTEPNAPSGPLAASPPGDIPHAGATRGTDT